MHNDYQRHLLYLWVAPDFEVQKVSAWLTWAQAADGHVHETLAGFNHGPLDVPGGRTMADTTSLVLLELHELWRHGALSTTQLAALWPGAARALRWCVANADGTDGYALPQHLTNTYDHFGFERRRAVAYNAFIYLAALRAAAALADHLGDTPAATLATSALAASTAAVVDPARLWNASGRFFRAHADDTPNPLNADQIMTDTLYGEMLAFHHFGSTSVAAPYLTSHLAAEWRANQDTFGMRVLSSPTQEDSIWMNGPPTWSYLALALGGDAAATGGAASRAGPGGGGGGGGDLGELGELGAALEPLRRMSENFRTRLKDMWNLRALTHTDGSVAPVETNLTLERGVPREQGHYAFMMTDLHLYALLAGQTVDLPRGVLALAPRFTPPYVLPVLAAGLEAALTSRRNGSYSLTVSFGRLLLPAGGLSVDGVPYPRPVRLGEGESVAWRR